MAAGVYRGCARGVGERTDGYASAMTRWGGLLLFFAGALGCATPRAPQPRGMPTSFSWLHSEGNCMYGGGVDAQGQVTGSSGCEEHGYNWPPRTLTAAETARLLAALDVLRASTTREEVDGGERACERGMTLELTERSGATRTWKACMRYDQMDYDPPLSAPFKGMLEALIWQ